MLEDTLVIWGREFGLTPMAQKDKGGPGRDHHMKGYSMFLCGGGIKGGLTYGATDELGYNAVENIVHVHDLTPAQRGETCEYQFRDNTRIVRDSPLTR